MRIKCPNGQSLTEDNSLTCKSYDTVQTNTKLNEPNCDCRVRVAIITSSKLFILKGGNFKCEME